MNRIDLPHFVWAMESLAAGVVVNQIQVDPETEQQALVALQRMLELPGQVAPRLTLASQPGRAPDRQPALQLLLHRQLRGEGIADLDLEQVVALLRRRLGAKG